MLHFLGSRVQRQRWDRLWSERGLLTTTECRRDQMGLHRGESVSFCLGEGVCVYSLICMQTKYTHDGRSEDLFDIFISV